MSTRLVSFSIVLGLVVAGCGGGRSGAGAGAVPEQNATSSYTEEEIVGALGVVPEEDGFHYVDPQTGCVVSVILTTPSEVALYADAGDPVASNPSRTAGVKYTTAYMETDPSTCYQLFTDRLKTLK